MGRRKGSTRSKYPIEIMNATRQHHRPLRSVLAGFLAIGILFGPIAISDRASAEPADDKRRQVAALADELERLEEKMNSLDEDYAEALVTQADLAAEIDQVQSEVAAAEAQLGQMRGTLYMSAVTQFMHGGRNSTLTNLLASSGGVQDALQRSELTSIAMNQGSLTTDSLDATTTELTKKKSVLEKKRKQSESVAANVLDRKSASKSLAKRYDQMKSSAQGDLVDLLREEKQRRETQALADSQREVERYKSKYSSVQSKYKNIPKVSARGQIAVNAALRQLGTPYIYAMSIPGRGFDCSGLTAYAWGVAGVSLARNSRAQFNTLPRIPKELAQPGDLIFSYTPISHVGIYLGGGRMVHAPNHGDVVKIGAIRWHKVVGVVRPG